MPPEYKEVDVATFLRNGVCLYVASRHPLRHFQAEWALPCRVAWGYSFKYSTRELPFYSVEERESLGQNTIKAVLMSEDWAMLSLVALNHLKVSYVTEEYEEAAVLPSTYKATGYPHGDRGDNHQPSAGEKYYCVQYYLGDKWPGY